jgi:hypothetical protein
MEDELVDVNKWREYFGLWLVWFNAAMGCGQRREFLRVKGAPIPIIFLNKPPQIAKAFAERFAKRYDLHLTRRQK